MFIVNNFKQSEVRILIHTHSSNKFTLDLRLTTATLSEKGVKAPQLLDCLSRNMSARRDKCISEVDTGVLFKETLSYQDDTTLGMFLERFVKTVFGQAKKYAERSII